MPTIEYLATIGQLKKALERIANYKKQTDDEDDYQSMISMMAIAQDAINPMVAVCSDD